MPSNQRPISKLIAVAALVLLAACQPASGDFDGWRYGVVTFDGEDSYSMSGTSSSASFTAPTSNTSANLRFVGTKTSAASTQNHTACATWSGNDSTIIQPGVAVRTQISGERRRAITLTNNVYLGARGLWNVHYADSAAATPMSALGSFDFSAALEGMTSAEVSPPWRFCLRAEGTTITAKVWPAGITEPSWTDSKYSKTMVVASSYVFSGQPGWYMGHLSPGESTSLTGP